MDSLYSINGSEVKTPSSVTISIEKEEKSRDLLESGKLLVTYKRQRKVVTWGYANLTGEDLKQLEELTVGTFDELDTYQVSMPDIDKQLTFEAILEGSFNKNLVVNSDNPLRKIYSGVTLTWREI